MPEGLLTKGKKNTHRVEEGVGPSESRGTFWSKGEVGVLGVIPGEGVAGSF